ncbi:pyridoxamine 5'-phosphate oxidase family protein [Candidatus Saccharibacteria bacterium]|nr:pyridoxamine 5'-phosphate oxidase family protein [Candidatus Saccharibacteria bacterium]
MEKTFDFLKNHTKVNFVSTIDGDKPSCRPFGDPVLFNGHLYAMTNANKNVAKQIDKNNNVCIVAYDGEDWIRISCQMIDESSNVEAKKAIIAEFEWAEQAGYTLDNPDFIVYRIANGKSTIYDEAGNILAEETLP